MLYDVNGHPVKEAEVVRCKNGAAVNFPEDYMRRRDPDSMRIGDGLDTDKPRFEDVYGYSFDELRTETFRWLTRQELILVPFKSGGYDYGYDSLLVCPRNAAFFGFAMAQLQAFVDVRTVEHFKPRAVVYAAPPFRHTHFGGKARSSCTAAPGDRHTRGLLLQPLPRPQRKKASTPCS